MRHNWILSSFILTASILGSCSLELGPERIDGGREIAVRLLSREETRSAVEGTVFPTSRNLVLSAYHNSVEGLSGNYFSGIAFRHSGSAWQGGKYWPQEGTLDFLAYSADGLSVSASYGTKVTGPMVLSVPDNSGIQTDILFGHVSGATYSAAGVPMVMKHAESLLVFSARNSEAFDASANKGITLNSIVLKDARYSGSCAIDPSAAEGAQCTWTLGSTTVQKPVPGASSLNLSDTFLPFGEGILVPEQGQTSFVIGYTMHNGRKAGGAAIDVDLEYTVTLDGEWSEGKKYLYEIVFDFDKISFNAVVTDWNTEDVDIDITGGSEVNNDPAVLWPDEHVKTWHGGTGELHCSGFGGDLHFEYSLDDGTTWSSVRPSWLGVALTDRDGTEQTYEFTISSAAPVRRTIPSTEFHENWTEANGCIVTPVGTESSPVDLSMRDVFGNATAQRNTANCYVVHQPGWYSLPLVYGNAVKDGALNTTSYAAAGTASAGHFYTAFPVFYNYYDSYSGRQFSSGYIKADLSALSRSVGSAGLVWSEGTDIISDISLTGLDDDIPMLQFYVSPDRIASSNSVICVRNDLGETVWSWHIWITNTILEEVNITNTDYSGVILNKVVGSIPGEIVVEEAPDVSCMVKVTTGRAVDSPYYVTILRKDCYHLVSVSDSRNVLFQWGRKDPVPVIDVPGYSIASFDSFNTTNESANTRMVKLYDGIRNPGVFYKTTYDYSLWSYDIGTYSRNIWNMNAYEDGGGKPAVKTVYDPCPAGYCMPHPDLLKGLGFTSDFEEEIAIYGENYLYDIAGLYLERYDGDEDGLYMSMTNHRSYTGDLAAYGFSSLWSNAQYSGTNAYELYIDRTGVSTSVYEAKIARASAALPMKEDK